MNLRVLIVAVAVACATASCGSKSTPTTPAPTTPAPVTPTASAPTLGSPSSDDQLSTLRPTLTVNNGTSNQTGSRLYEFQIADRSDFGAPVGPSSLYYTAAVTKGGISEGTTTTAVTLDADLQPATRFYWRARWVQGAVTSDWSPTGTFRSQIIGYNRANELYDPLVNGATVSDFTFKRISFVAGKGLRVGDSDSYVRYKLPQTITDGEFSLDIEGLSDSPVSENPDTAKLKILSMCDCTTDIAFSDYLMNVQYRGFNGNPPNAISFKMLFGVDDDAHKLEPDLGTRTNSVRHLNASSTYFWKATWGHFFHLNVYDGGVGGVNGSGSGIGGTSVYDYGQTTIYTYNPSSHWAYLGVNNSGSESGSWPNVIYRNVWLSNKARPATLGTAMAPK